MGPLARYLLFQIPGWVGIVVLVGWLWPRMGWSFWTGMATVAVWVGKDALLYPWLRSAYDRASWTDPARLRGRVGVVTQDIDPIGYVRLGSELWRARSSSGLRLPSGARVRVESCEGLTLVVVLREGPSDDK
jgi:membrane protein implicated in regulation of membrane protease activity